MLGPLGRLFRRTLRSKWFRHFAFLIFSLYGLSAGYAVGIALGLLHVPDAAARIWHWIKSDIAKDIFLSFLAAYAGTSGAQLISEWNSKRKEKLAEIHAANAAIVLAFNISHAYVAAKMQLVTDVIAEYRNVRLNFISFEIDMAANLIPKGTFFQYHVELRTVDPPFSPIDDLKRVLVETLIADPSHVFALTSLIQSIEAFAQACRGRNEWIEEYKALGEGDQFHKLELYCGLRQKSGRTDDRHPELLRALGRHTDDCIGFGMLIAERLRHFAIKSKEEFTKEFGPGAPRIANPKFLDEIKHVLPDPAFFESYKKTVYPEVGPT